MSQQQGLFGLVDVIFQAIRVIGDLTVHLRNSESDQMLFHCRSFIHVLLSDVDRQGLKMEKFTKFRDPGTGIAPFLPIAPASRTPLILPLEFTLCLFRIPFLFLVLGLEIILVEIFADITLRRIFPPIVSWTRWIFLRTVLLLCGIWHIDEQLEGLTKSSSPITGRD